MNLYINTENIITSGDMQDDSIRLLTQDEIVLFQRGYGFEIQEYSLVDIVDTPEYQQAEIKKQNEILIKNLLNEIEVLDKKRIRAVCEPSLRDDGQSWLEYYNNLIQEKRQQISNITP